MNIFYISDAMTLEAWLRNNGRLKDEILYFTCDIEVAFYLNKRGSKYINGKDLIRPGEIEQNWHLAHSLSEQWLSGISEFNNILGFSPLTCAQQDLVYPFQSALNAKIIIQKLIKEYNITNLEGVANQIVPLLRTAPGPIASNSVAEAIFINICQKNSIKVNIERLNSEAQTRFTSLNRLAKLPKNKLKSGNNAFENLIIVYRDGMPFEEYCQLINTINSKNGWRTITITRDSLLYSLISSKEYEETYAKIQQAEKSWIFNSGELVNEFTEIFINRDLQFQFDKIKQELCCAILAGIKFYQIIELTNARGVFFGHAAFTFERLLCRVANAKGIDTTELLHGGAGFKLQWRGVVGESKRVLVWNNIDLTLLERYGVDTSRTKIHSPFRRVANDSENNNKANEWSESQRNKKLITIITTAIDCGLSAPLGNATEHVDGVNELIKLIKDHPWIDFTIRAHPNYDYYSVYRWVSELGFKNFKQFLNKSTAEIIAQSNVCVMFNYYSSAGIECFKTGVPVIYYERSIFKLPDWASSYDLLDVHIPAAKNYIELTKLINSLLVDNSFRSRCINAGYHIYEQLFPLSRKEDQIVFEFSDGTTSSISKRVVGNNNSKYSHTCMLAEYWCSGAIKSNGLSRLLYRDIKHGEALKLLTSYFSGALQSNQRNFAATSIAIAFNIIYLGWPKSNNLMKLLTAEYMVLRYGYVASSLYNRYHDAVSYVHKILTFKIK